MFRFLAVSCWLLLVSYAFSSVSAADLSPDQYPQPSIPKPPALIIANENQYPNWGGYCVWADFDTLARHHNIPTLRGIVRQRWDKAKGAVPNPGYDHLIKQELTARGLKFKMTPQQPNMAKQDNSLLRKYANTLGVQVACRMDDPYYRASHSLLVVDYNPATVTFYDCNRKARQLPETHLTCSRAYFDKWWLGSSVVIFPEGYQDVDDYATTESLPTSPDSQ